MSTHDPNAPAKLATFTHELAAAALANELKRHGIDAKLRGENVAGFRAETPAEVEVVVPANQLEEAKAILAKTEAAGEVDWSQVDTGDRTLEN